MNALTTLKLTSASSSAMPDLAQRRLDRLLGEAGLAAQRLEDVLEAVAEGIEHGDSPATAAHGRATVTRPANGDGSAVAAAQTA